MKRSTIKKSVSDYQIAFDAIKPSVHLRSGGLCEARYFAQSYAPQIDESVIEAFKSVQCGLRATNTHHRKYRSRGGTNALENLLDLCGPCHSFAHARGGFGQPANILGLALSAGQSESLAMSHPVE